MDQERMNQNIFKADYLSMGSLNHVSDDLEDFDSEREENQRFLGKCIDAIGNGRYQQKITLILGFCNCAMAVAIGSFSFLINEMHDVEDAKKGFLGGAAFIGMLCGSIFWGVLSDRWGRKPSLLITLTVVFVFLMAIAGSPNWMFTMIYQALCGFGISGITSVVFALLAECLALPKRGIYLTLVAWFWMVGGFYSAGAAWVMLSTYHLSWRLYAVVSALVPFAAFFLVLFFVDESPRFLYVHGQRPQALRLLQEMAAANGTTESLQRSLSSRPCVYWKDSLIPPSCSFSMLCSSIQSASRMIASLFGSEVRSTTLLLSMIFFCISYAWYGLMMFLPIILDHLDIKLDIYASTFIVVSGNLPGNVLGTLVIDWFRRKHLLVASMLLCSVIALALAFSSIMDSAAYSITLAVTFSMVSTVAWNVLACINAELFPTELRNSGMGLSLALGRVGSLVSMIASGYLVSGDLLWMLLLIAISLIAGCACSVFLRESGAAHLEDFVDTSQTGSEEFGSIRPEWQTYQSVSESNDLH